MPRVTVCKDCEERYPACHDYCERYLNQVKEGRESLEKYKAESKGDYQLKQMYSEKKARKLKRFGGKLW